VVDRAGPVRGRAVLVGMGAVHEAMVSFDALLDDEWGAVDHALPADLLEARPAVRDRLRGDGPDLEARIAGGPRLPRARWWRCEAQAEAEGGQGGRRGMSHERFTPSAS